MRILAALALAGALCAVAVAPFGWIALTAPVQFQPRANRIVPDFEVALRHPPDLASRGRTWWLDKTMLTGEGWHQAAPVAVTVLPRPRPQATALLLAEARAALGKGPREIGVRRDLWCADAINQWLKRVGLKGTGSALAASFRNWGKPAKPAPGVVALKPRRGGSGHVVVIARVRGKVVETYSPNGGRNRVRYTTYPVKVFTAFRAPA